MLTKWYVGLDDSVSETIDFLAVRQISLKLGGCTVYEGNSGWVDGSGEYCMDETTLVFESYHAGHPDTVEQITEYLKMMYQQGRVVTVSIPTSKEK